MDRKIFCIFISQMIGLKLERVLAAGKLLRSQNTTSPPKDIADHTPQPGLRFQYTVKVYMQDKT